MLYPEHLGKLLIHSAIVDKRRKRFLNNNLQFYWQKWEIINDFCRVLNEIDNVAAIFVLTAFYTYKKLCAYMLVQSISLP